MKQAWRSLFTNSSGARKSVAATVPTDIRDIFCCEPMGPASGGIRREVVKHSRFRKCRLRNPEPTSRERLSSNTYSIGPSAALRCIRSTISDGRGDKAHELRRCRRPCALGFKPYRLLFKNGMHSLHRGSINTPANLAHR